MNIFEYRNGIIDDYSNYIRSFINIEDERISQKVFDELRNGLFWFI